MEIKDKFKDLFSDPAEVHNVNNFRKKIVDSATGCKKGYTRRTIIMRAEHYEAMRYLSRSHLAEHSIIYLEFEKCLLNYFNIPENKAKLKEAQKKGFIGSP